MLTQLSDLEWYGSEGLTDAGLEQLTALTGLSSLHMFDMPGLSPVVSGDKPYQGDDLILTTSVKVGGCIMAVCAFNSTDSTSSCRSTVRWQSARLACVCCCMMCAPVSATSHRVSIHIVLACEAMRLTELCCTCSLLMTTVSVLFHMLCMLAAA
jgi:hypothetical protein